VLEKRSESRVVELIWFLLEWIGCGGEDERRMMWKKFLEEDEEKRLRLK
jgi:hypothetical protein